MDQARIKASSREGSGTLGSPEELRPVLADRDGGDRREVVVKLDGNGNGHAPFSFHGAAGGGGGRAGNAGTSGTNSTATTPLTATTPRSSETTSPRSPAKVWRDGSYEFWNNDGGGGGAEGRRPATEAFSFKNRPPPQASSPSLSPPPQASSPSLSPPPQQQPAASAAADGGGVDPPTRLIGNFLRREAAFSCEKSLDFDLEDLGRTTQLCSLSSFSGSLERDAPSGRQGAPLHAIVFLRITMAGSAAATTASWLESRHALGSWTPRRSRTRHQHRPGEGASCGRRAARPR